MSTEVPTWGAPTEPVPAAPEVHDGGVEDCGGTCAACQVKTAGARAMGASFGIDYDTETPATQAHLRHVVSHVYSAMSEAILELPGIKSMTTGALHADGTITEVEL